MGPQVSPIVFHWAPCIVSDEFLLPMGPREQEFQRGDSVVIRGNIQGGGLEKDKKLGFAFLPFLFIFPILFLLPFFRPSTPRRRLTHSTNTKNKNQIKKIISIVSLIIVLHCYRYYEIVNPPRIVLLRLAVTFFAHLYQIHPFPCHFRTREPPIQPYFIRFLVLFRLFRSFYFFTFFIIIIPPFLVLYLYAKI